MNKRLPMIQATYMSFFVVCPADFTKMRAKNPDGLQNLYIIFNYGVGDTQEDLDTRCIWTVGLGYTYITSLHPERMPLGKPLIWTSSVDAIVQFNMFGHIMFDFELSK